MDRGRTYLFVALGVAVFAWWWLSATPTPQRPTAQREATPTTQRSYSLPEGTPKAPPDAEFQTEEPPPPFEAINPMDEALHALSEYTGEGYLRCAAPGITDGTVTGRFSRGFVQDGWLSAMVMESEGNSAVFAPGEQDALLVIRWTRAWSGEQGLCLTEDVKLVAIRGTVVDTEGRPVSGVSVRGCNDDKPISDNSGAFETRGRKWESCLLSARSQSGGGWSTETVVIPTGDDAVTGVQLTTDETGQAQQFAFDLLDALDHAEQEAEQEASPYSLALQHSDLSEEATDILRTMEEGHEQLRTMSQMMEAMGDLPTPVGATRNVK